MNIIYPETMQSEVRITSNKPININHVDYSFESIVSLMLAIWLKYTILFSACSDPEIS